MIAVKDRSLPAFRLVVGATLLALLWKVMFFVVISGVYFRMPLRQRLFPAFFESPMTFAVSYTSVVMALTGLLLVRSGRWRRRGAWAALVAVSILCVHQGSYNDATFTTAWWTLLWSAWFAGRMGQRDHTLLERGARLSRTIIAMILLGGAVGKWTSEYWSGQVLYEIYCIDRDFWLFNLLRANVDSSTLRETATWYSRGVIVVESVCGLVLWALPVRVAALLAMSVLGGMVLFSNFYLVSVLLSLAGLASVGLLVSSARPVALTSPTRRAH